MLIVLQVLISSNLFVKLTKWLKFRKNKLFLAKPAIQLLTRIINNLNTITSSCLTKLFKIKLYNHSLKNWVALKYLRDKTQKLGTFLCIRMEFMISIRPNQILQKLKDNSLKNRIRKNMDQSKIILCGSTTNKLTYAKKWS